MAPTKYSGRNSEEGERGEDSEKDSEAEVQPMPYAEPYTESTEKAQRARSEILIESLCGLCATSVTSAYGHFCCQIVAKFVGEPPPRLSAPLRLYTSA
jgi:hypothetical protein